MEKVIEKIVSILKLPIRFVFIIGLIMGLLLVFPEKVVQKLQLTDFKSEYGKYIGPIFLVSVVYLGVILVIFLWNKIKGCIAKKKFNKNIVEVLNSLSLPDIYLLREFVLQGKDVIEVPYASTEFTSLYNKGILVIASNNVRAYIFGQFVSVTINPMVKKYINHDVLHLPKGNATQAQIDEIKQNRPAYLSSLNYVDSLMKNIGRFGI